MLLLHNDSPPCCLLQAPFSLSLLLPRTSQGARQAPYYLCTSPAQHSHLNTAQTTFTTPRAGLVSSDKLRLALLTLWANILSLRSFRNELVDGGLHSCVRWWVVGCGREMNEISFDQSTFLVTFLVLLIFFRINVIMTYILYI